MLLRCAVELISRIAASSDLQRQTAPYAGEADGLGRGAQFVFVGEIEKHVDYPGQDPNTRQHINPVLRSMHQVGDDYCCRKSKQGLEAFR